MTKHDTIQHDTPGEIARSQALFEAIDSLTKPVLDRALDKLLEFGLVHRLESINAFVACAHPEEGCHAHGITAFTICETCGKVTEFHDHMIEERLKGFARDRNFKTGKTTIEIRGTCAGCA